MKISETVDYILNAIAYEKQSKAELPNSDWSEDTKFKMDIFHTGKIKGLEQALAIIQSLNK